MLVSNALCRGSEADVWWAFKLAESIGYLSFGCGDRNVQKPGAVDATPGFSHYEGGKASFRESPLMTTIGEVETARAGLN